MSLLDSLSPQAVAKYVELGRQFSCQDAIKQADHSCAAFDKYADALVKHGFIQDDVVELKEARDRLVASLAEDTTGEHTASKKKTWMSYVNAVRHGKNTRMQARSILHIIAQRLVYSTDPVDVEAARVVLNALHDTESSRGDPLLLAVQLEQLRGTITIPRVRRRAWARGADAVAPDLVETAARLRSVVAARSPNVAPASTTRTEQADLLCGVIVEFVRDARRAARSASRTLLQPEIASAFELVELHAPVASDKPSV